MDNKLTKEQLVAARREARRQRELARIARLGEINARKREEFAVLTKRRKEMAVKEFEDKKVAYIKKRATEKVALEQKHQRQLARLESKRAKLGDRYEKARKALEALQVVDLESFEEKTQAGVYHNEVNKNARLEALDARVVRFNNRHIEVSFEDRVDRMRYQNNKLGQMLTLLALLANVVAFISIYEHAGVRPSFQVAQDVLINILFILTAFLASEKLKTYSSRWSIVAMAMAGVQVLRIFYIPLLALAKNQISGATFVQYMVYYLISGAALVAAGIITYIRSRDLREHLEALKGAE